MMNANSNINLQNFRAAKAVALGLDLFVVDHNGNLDNPFFGANLPGLGRVVVWKHSDSRADMVPDGTVEMLNHIFAYKRLTDEA